jgi:hypothetical protein
VRADKEAFYRGQQRTAGGFMALARTTLDLLNTLSGDAVIVSVITCYLLCHLAAWGATTNLTQGEGDAEPKPERGVGSI